MNRYICIHGHFYQPPRENPWLEAIEVQDSAYPYHDWNQRITAECYGPNANARILDDRGHITRIVNNYERISFNFGPTLLSWLEIFHPDTYRAILEADRRSLRRFGGHGSALAQVYSHMIMPLAHERDKRTQVIWGIRDFERRFQRKPEGMWLAETAADVASLEALAEQGIKFTILAPNQAARTRPIGSRKWTDVSGERVRTGMPYRLDLPSGRTIDLFFYDGAISRAVAFEHLLAKGDRFASRLLDGFDDASEPQLVHIATDGETYGHHHRFGDMALAYALHSIDTGSAAQLTNYGEYLELQPPTHQVEIAENTSWSCAHGVGRWMEDCGCSGGGHPDWNQRWRAPLRQALDWLRDSVAPHYEHVAANLLQDPWAARDEFIDVILDRSEETIDEFLSRHAMGALAAAERTKTLKLLELQRQTMLMYTSCGWFFDEVSGIETAQILQYAGRAIQLSEELFGDGLEAEFARRLARAESNLREQRNARSVYERTVWPARVDLAKAGANFAASLLFDDRDLELTHGFDVSCDASETAEAGQARLVRGTLDVRSKITLEQSDFEFAFVHFGDHNLLGAVRESREPNRYESMAAELEEAFSRVQVTEMLQQLERHFHGPVYSLQTLFRDQQRRIVKRILETTVREAEAAYERLYDRHAPLMRFLNSMNTPPPRPLAIAAELVLNTSLRRQLRAPELDLGRLQSLLEEARNSGAELDRPGLAFWTQETLEHLARGFGARPADLQSLDRLQGLSLLAREHSIDVDMRNVENCYYRVLQSVFPGYRERSLAGEEAARHWVKRFGELGEILRIGDT